jgi:hypothetical protein
MSPQYYTQVYDAIAIALKKVQPSLKFSALAIGTEMFVASEGNLKEEPGIEYLRYFLNSSNHAKGAPIDYVSYHFYGAPASRTDPNSYSVVFSQADEFLAQVKIIEGFRKSMNPTVKTCLDEMGSILPNDNDQPPVPFPDIYWNAGGALFAYEFGILAPLGIEILGESQLIGFPSQFPSVSLMTYPEGKPTARFWVLYLLHKHFSVGDKICTATSDDRDVFASAYSTSHGKKVLLINKTNGIKSVTVASVTSGQIEYVDLTTGTNAPAIVNITSSTFNMNAFGVAILIIP